MKTVRLFLLATLFVFSIVALKPDFVWSAEVDDATLFVDAFSAYQGGDYLLAIEKLNTLTQLFPDSPLRDVTLLLLARSSLKSGDNEQAAKTINKFNQEFSSNPLSTTVEEELILLGARFAKGEKLKQNKSLRLAAQKTRNEHLAKERAIAQKREQERIAKQKAEEEKIARAKEEAERKERQRIAAEKADKESIRIALNIGEEGRQTDSGRTGTISIEFLNQSSKEEPLTVESTLSSEYDLKIYSADNSKQALDQITIPAGKSFKGSFSYKMPADKVDGHKIKGVLKLTSKRYQDVHFTKEFQLTAAAPLLRAVAKAAKPVVARGEQTRYKVTLLNIGSRTATNLTVRATIPPQFDFIDAGETKYKQESSNLFVFVVESLESGKLVEFNLNIKARSDAQTDQKLFGQTEIINGELQQKQTSNSSPVTIKN